ncbi:hypothetical protein ATANTOWER_000475, partial [Ataeniobius toweri]|nr:hypothetical protein [Ataeniobius toweri]
QRLSPDLRTRIQVSSYLLWTKFKLVASWLFDYPAQVISKPCPPSNKLSRKYLQPVLHTIIPHSSHNPGSELLKTYLLVCKLWRDLPPQYNSCVAYPDPASLIPLAVRLPLPLVISRSRISNPYHSRENKTFKTLCESIQCVSACGEAGTLVDESLISAYCNLFIEIDTNKERDLYTFVFYNYLKWVMKTDPWLKEDVPIGEKLTITVLSAKSLIFPVVQC